MHHNAKAMLSEAKEPRMRLRIVQGFKPECLRLVASWNIPLSVFLDGEGPAVAPQLTTLAQEGVSLPRVVKLRCDDVLLSAYAPSCFATLFPNLQDLELRGCQMADGTLPLTGCTNLQTLAITRRTPSPTVTLQDGWLPQLNQLASLPSLTSLTFPPHDFTAAFLPLCATQLTQLTMEYTEPAREEDAVMHEEQWLAVLFLTGTCTNLRQLQIGPCQTEEVDILMSSLPHLNNLYLSWGNLDRAGSSAGLATTLLQYTQLTHLSCSSLEGIEQSCADSPCSWKELRMQCATPDTLSKLPLHSLTQPLQLQRLDLCDADGKQATVEVVQAAARNLARSAAPSVGDWLYNVPYPPLSNIELFFGREEEVPPPQKQQEQQEDTRVALLLAAQPLIPRNLTMLTIDDSTLNKQLLVALRAVVGPDVFTFSAGSCTMHPSCWTQLGRSFPRLHIFEASNPHSRCTGAQVMAYLWAAREATRGEEEEGLRRGVYLRYNMDRYEYDEVSWSEHAQDMGSVGEQLRLLGVDATVSMDYH